MQETTSHIKDVQKKKNRRSRKKLRKPGLREDRSSGKDRSSGDRGNRDPGDDRKPEPNQISRQRDEDAFPHNIF